MRRAGPPSSSAPPPPPLFILPPLSFGRAGRRWKKPFASASHAQECRSASPVDQLSVISGQIELPPFLFFLQAGCLPGSDNSTTTDAEVIAATLARYGVLSAQECTDKVAEAVKQHSASFSGGGRSGGQRCSSCVGSAAIAATVSGLLSALCTAVIAVLMWRRSHYGCATDTSPPLL